MKQFIIISKSLNKVVFVYSSVYERNLNEYQDDDFVSHEVEAGKEPTAYKWDGSDVVYDANLEKEEAHFIMSELTNVSHKPIESVDYRVELKSGVRLHGVKTKSNDGRTTNTKYYHGYQDAQNKGVLVFETDVAYEIDDDSHDYQSGKNIDKTTKSWKYYKKDGTDKVLKTEEMIHDDDEKRNSEGVKRRKSIVFAMYRNVITAGVIDTTFADEADGRDKIGALLTTHENAHSAWETTADGAIYADIAADATAWLDAVVPDNGTTQATVPQMIGMKYKDYIVDKLKGNIA